MENCKSQYEEEEKYYQLLKGLNKKSVFAVMKDEIEEVYNLLLFQLSEFKEIQLQEDKK